jgi:hypothetical protein
MTTNKSGALRFAKETGFARTASVNDEAALEHFEKSNPFLVMKTQKNNVGWNRVLPLNGNAINFDDKDEGFRVSIPMIDGKPLFPNSQDE